MTDHDFEIGEPFASGREADVYARPTMSPEEVGMLGVAAARGRGGR